MSLGRDLQHNLQTDRAVDKDEDGFEKPTPKDRKDNVATMLGLMGSIAVETIMSDIGRLIDKKLYNELDGYILALSRIMRHDMAWQCIVHVFSDKNEPIPSKYSPQFGQQSSMTVQRMTAK